MLSYNKMKQILSTTRESVMKINYTLSPQKFNEVSDFAFRLFLVGKLNKLTNAPKEEKEALSENLISFIETRESFSYVCELHNQKEKIKEKVLQDQFLKSGYENASKSGLAEIENAINKKANYVMKEIFLYYVELCNKFISTHTEEDYNNLYSETIEKYLNILNDAKKEVESEIVETEEKKLNVEKNVDIEENIEPAKHRSFFSKLFKKNKI